MQSDLNRKINEIITAQRFIGRTIHSVADSAWIDANLTMAQLKTLIVLSDEGPQPIGSVGQRLGVTLPTASYQVDRLVRAGLVRRTEDSTDRRRTLVSLTEQADELIRNLRQGQTQQMRAWIEQLDSNDLEALHRGMRALQAIANTSIESLTGEPVFTTSRGTEDE